MSSEHGAPSQLTPARAFDRLLVLVALIGVAVAILAVVAATRDPAPAGTPAAPSLQHAILELTEFGISGDLAIAPGPARIEVHNKGGIPHDLAIEGGPATPMIDPGETAVMEVDLAPGSYTILCTVPGHREAGMEATLVIAQGSEPTAGDDSHAEADWATLDQAMHDSILSFPAETEGRGNQPLEPTILADGIKQFELTVAITPWEVEPGRVVEAWTYNGQVPGPMIRVDLGDRVRVIVNNELPMGTDVHWHGIRVPNEMDGVSPLTQDLIEPGETFIYEFTAVEPAIGMYHAHHHGQMQVPNGLFGVFMIGETPLPRGQTISGVEIPANLVADHEIPMVLNDAGVIGLSLNGKSFPATEPYVGKVGDWVVAHYYNEGLQVHPMHQHQFPQLVFAKDGIPVDQPYWADTVNVAPGERYSVLYQLSDPGVWVWHCHVLTHVEREEGMFGMVTAWIVEP